jgi:SAM-dependent methyltransferase
VNTRALTSAERIAVEFEQVGPWVFRFRIDNADYGGAVSAVGDARVEWFWRFAPEARRILELGSLEGAHTVLLAERATRVVGIEGREVNLRKAQLVQRLLGLRKVDFVQANLESAELAQFGHFDAVFCSGLLYHLPEPWKLIAQLPRVAPKLLLWTHYCAELAADTAQDGFRGRMHLEGGAAEPLSGMSPTAFWLTLGSLINLLTASGYKSVHVLQNDITHPNGPAVTIGASTHEMSTLRTSRWAKAR